MSISPAVNVTICSPFRDSASLVDDYMRRVAELKHPPEATRYVFVEGDSVDGTWGLLQWWQGFTSQPITLIKCDTGSPHFGSVVNAARFRTLATVFNAALDAVDYDWTDYVLFLPCDIHYKPDLLQRLVAHGEDIVAPGSWTYEAGRYRFFDEWAFMRNGVNFERFPQAEVAARYGAELLPMDSVGGTVLIKSAVLRSGCRYTLTEVDRGLCGMARSKGFSVFADLGTHVYHPPLSDVPVALLNDDATNCAMADTKHTG